MCSDFFVFLTEMTFFNLRLLTAPPSVCTSQFGQSPSPLPMDNIRFTHLMWTIFLLIFDITWINLSNNKLKFFLLIIASKTFGKHLFNFTVQFFEVPKCKHSSWNIKNGTVLCLRNETFLKQVLFYLCHKQNIKEETAPAVGKVFSKSPMNELCYTIVCGYTLITWHIGYLNCIYPHPRP
jgi:hypothetical protein